jgi:hypothetical protein
MAGLRKRAANKCWDRSMTREIAAQVILRDGSRDGRLVVRSLIALAFLTTVGCGGGTVTNKPPDESYLRGLVRTYSTAARDLGRPPKDIEEIKAIYGAVDPDPAKYVRSPRDGEEFVVVWGLDLDRATADTVVAYERKGADGKRMVVTADSTVKEVTNDELKQMKFPKDHKPEI